MPDITDHAAGVRAELAERFPGTRFSVTSHRVLNGESYVLVRWADGPEWSDVQRALAFLRRLGRVLTVRIQVVRDTSDGRVQYDERGSSGPLDDPPQAPVRPDISGGPALPF